MFIQFQNYTVIQIHLYIYQTIGQLTVSCTDSIAPVSVAAKPANFAEELIQVFPGHVDEVFGD